jgi:hypothetical protein
MQQSNPSTAEIMIQGKQGNNALFGFLQVDGPWHTYYQYVKKQIQEGTWEKPELNIVVEPKEVEKQPIPLPPPIRPHVGSLNMSEEELGIVKRTAAFVAKNGSSFELMLRKRNAKDSRFHFLQPWHPFHPTFRALVQNEQFDAESDRDSAAISNQSSEFDPISKAEGKESSGSSARGLVGYDSSSDEEAA